MRRKLRYSKSPPPAEAAAPTSMWSTDAARALPQQRQRGSSTAELALLYLPRSSRWKAGAQAKEGSEALELPRYRGGALAQQELGRSSIWRLRARGEAIR